MDRWALKEKSVRGDTDLECEEEGLGLVDLVRLGLLYSASYYRANNWIIFKVGTCCLHTVLERQLGRKRADDNKSAFTGRNCSSSTMLVAFHLSLFGWRTSLAQRRTRSAIGSWAVGKKSKPPDFKKWVDFVFAYLMLDMLIYADRQFMSVSSWFSRTRAKHSCALHSIRLLHLWVKACVGLTMPLHLDISLKELPISLTYTPDIAQARKMELLKWRSSVKSKQWNGWNWYRNPRYPNNWLCCVFFCATHSIPAEPLKRYIKICFWIYIQNAQNDSDPFCSALLFLFSGFIWASAQLPVPRPFA